MFSASGGITWPNPCYYDYYCHCYFILRAGAPGGRRPESGTQDKAEWRLLVTPFHNAYPIQTSHCTPSIFTTVICQKQNKARREVAAEWVISPELIAKFGT